MNLHTEPLTDAGLDEVVGFMRAANPFSQYTWGWDTGRFIDFRFGGNAVRDQTTPGFFERHCTLVRRDGELTALVIAEVGAEDHCIITRGEDQRSVADALQWLVAQHEGERLVLYPSDEAEWVHEVFTDSGFAKGEIGGLEWGYDITAAETPVAPEGFVVGALAGPEDYSGIDHCLEGAFGGNRNRVPILESLAGNPLFRPDLNIVARAEDGRIAAYCRGTVDPGSGVCGIDPVATHPDFHRRGLGEAIVLTCFANQRRLGGAISFIGSAPEGSAGSRLYRKLRPASVTSYSEWAKQLR